MPALVTPACLADLFAVFDRLDQGERIALLPPASAAVGPVSEAPDQSAWLGVTSSGSTGTPKLVWRRWAELRVAVVLRPEVTPWKWASPYEPYTFAGVQVGVQAWRTSRWVFSLAGDWERLWGLLFREQVEALSATPTFVDLLVQNEPRGMPTWQPRQITLGGEPLRTALGARLRNRFPATNFTVIYAAAEFGVLAQTHRLDGWYELESLARHRSGWRIVDGVLQVSRGDAWRPTGDRVETRGGLLRVVGRADHVANVGGTKVSLAEVGDLAEQVPGVRRATAVAEANPVTGQIVCLKYAVEPGSDPTAVLNELQHALRERLRKEAWPRRWVCDEVGPTRNAKRAVK